MPVLPATRILIVDDNNYAATCLGRFLTGLGKEVEVVSDGVAALGKIDEFHPHVVLVDIAMPGMDGYEVARRIRSRQDGHDVVLIALTGLGPEGQRDNAATADFDEHLVKPIEPEQLESVLDDCLARRARPFRGGSVGSSANV